MRILIIHNHYQHPGGEDAVFEQEKTLLADTEEVASLVFRNRSGWKGAWQTLWSPWNFWAGRKVKKAIRQHRPDIIHIHNLHYAIGPIAIRIAKKRHIPVVMTLHNYRLLCPSATLFHKGGIFTDSLQAAFPWKAIGLGVHSHSAFKTFWLALTVWLHKQIGTWNMVDRYITLTDFAKQLFANSTFGVAAGKFAVKPNFITMPPPHSVSRQHHFLYIGRLAEEKGVNTLLEAFAHTGAVLRIAGDGPLRDQVTESCAMHPNMTYLGMLTKAEIADQLASCTALVFPSTWYEGMPMTLIEAFAASTPVIASDLGAMRTMVEDGENGRLFPSGDAAALRKRIDQWLVMDDIDRRHMGNQARKAYEKHYSTIINKNLLLDIYQSVLSQASQQDR